MLRPGLYWAVWDKRVLKLSLALLELALLELEMVVWRSRVAGDALSDCTAGVVGAGAGTGREQPLTNPPRNVIKTPVERADRVILMVGDA